MKLRKFFTLIIALAIVCNISVMNIAYASESPNISSSPVIQQLLEEINEIGDYSNMKVLRDADNEERFYYLPFETGGYLIYDSNLNIVHEYSRDKGNAFIERNSDLYYLGALRYFHKVGGKYVELPTGNTIASADFTNLADAIEQNIISKTLMRSNTRAATASNTISGSVPNYSYNPDGICGSTASAMMLRWYDLNVNQNYVPSSLESSDGVALIEHLRGYIDGDSPGSTTGDVYNGIISYCSNQGVSHDGGFSVVDISYVVGRVDTYERPFVLGLNNHPTYHDHWVTGYGYSIRSSGDFAIVNDGWGNRGVEINLVGCDYIVW